MAKADAVFVYMGTYPGEATARADYDVVGTCMRPARSAPTTPP